MVVTVSTPYVDTAASELTWTLGHEPMEALVSSRPRVRRGWVELRVLGASHQVLVRGLHGTYSETVACLPGQVPELPPHSRGEIEGWGYVFGSAVELLDAEPFAARVRDLVTSLEGRPGGALVASFPGSPLAVTALAMDDNDDSAVGLEWRTWHAYPQTHEIVTTSTQVMPR